MPDAARAQVGRATLAGLQRNRGVRALLGGLGRGGGRRVEGGVVEDRLLERRDRGGQRVQDGLVAERGRTELGDRGGRRVQRGDQLPGRGGGFGQGLAGGAE